MQHLQIIPVAEASVQTLIKSIDRVIINPIILFLFACAMVYFLYGVAQYLLSPDNEEVRKKSKSHMLWGVIGLFIMVGVFGIMNIILKTLGVNNIKINSSGDYVVNSGTQPINKTPVGGGASSGSDIFTPIPINTVDQPSLAPVTEQLPNSTYTTSPFTKVYTEVPALCWHDTIHQSASTEYRALQLSKDEARTKYLRASGVAPTDHLDYPYIFDRKIMYDTANKTYHVWWDVRAPVGTGKLSDCNLAVVVPPAALPAPDARSTKPNPLVNSYVSDATYYRVVDSGVADNLGAARAKAISNALIEIARLKGLTSTTALYTGAQSLEEQYYVQDPATLNYDYWIAIQYKK